MATPVAVTNAVSALRNAENGALTRSAANEESLYTGSGRDLTPTKTKVKGKGKKKGFAALITIIALFVGGGTFLGSSNSLLMGALNNLPTEATNTQGPSNTMRAKILAKFMAAGTPKSATWPTSGFSKSFLRNLSNNHITSSKSGNTTTLFFDGVEINSNNFDEIYTNNAAFRDAYDSSRKGKIASFFDNIAEKFYSLRKISRNWLFGAKSTGDAAADAEAYNKRLASEFDNNATSQIAGESPTKRKEKVYNEETGEWETKIIDDTLDGATDKSSTSANDKTEVKTKAEGYISKVASTVSDFLNLGCGVYKVGNLIAMTVAANSMYQAAQSFMKFMESISKTMAGEGDSAMIHEALNKVSSTVTTTGENDEEITGSALEATGLQLVLGGAYATLGTTAISAISKSYSNERAMSSLLGNGYAMNACSANEIANSVISLAVNLGGGVAGIVGGILLKTAGAVVLSGLASVLISFLVPAVTSLFVNTAITVIGKPFGETLMNGFGLNMMLSMKSGLSLTTQTTATQHNKLTNEVLALNAEVDRMKLSPFDITNKNTFFGSIAYNLLPTFTTSKIFGVTPFLRTVSKSITSLSGKALADGPNTSYITTFGDCPALESIGAVGDIYCNPITTIDTSTISLSPEDPTYQNAINSQVTHNGSNDSYEIKDDSNLAKYITYCNSRTSPFGVADAGILSSLQTNNSVINALGYVPIIGDVVSILHATEDLSNLDWATGKKCVNDGREEWNNEFRYYQRYVEDQRLLEQMGAYEGSQNPVTAYEERYEKTHPLDNSPSGYLARVTGMTKDDANLVIALAGYSDFLENYDAGTRIAMEDTPVPTGQEIAATVKADLTPEFAKSSSEQRLIAHNQYIIYADVRNRSYAA